MSRRVFQQLFARVGIAAILFTQLALAAYACPMLGGAVGGVSGAVDEMPTPMSGCEELDSTNPNLCLKYCQSASQLSHNAPQFVIPPVPSMLVAILEPVEQAVPDLGVAARSILIERQTSPPPLILFGVLRI